MNDYTDDAELAAKTRRLYAATLAVWLVVAALGLVPIWLAMSSPVAASPALAAGMCALGLLGAAHTSWRIRRFNLMLRNGEPATTTEDR